MIKVRDGIIKFSDWCKVIHSDQDVFVFKKLSSVDLKNIREIDPSHPEFIRMQNLISNLRQSKIRSSGPLIVIFNSKFEKVEFQDYFKKNLPRLHQCKTVEFSITKDYNKSHVIEMKKLLASISDKTDIIVKVWKEANNTFKLVIDDFITHKGLKKASLGYNLYGSFNTPVPEIMQEFASKLMDSESLDEITLLPNLTFRNLAEKKGKIKSLVTDFQVWSNQIFEFDIADKVCVE
mmetsp:Transcript_43473/g.51171  ORF Transcript_43473/g.51171 Transcript_43473/m.51171 type:complete len:235 (-) Transcript_43473:198-902(-)